MTGHLMVHIAAARTEKRDLYYSDFVSEIVTGMGADGKPVGA